MTAQLSLTLTIAEQRAERERTLDARFADFVAENPHVVDLLERLALDLLARGRKHGSMKMLFEVARWQHALTTTDPDWKLNNSYTSRASRLLEQRRPELRGFFEMRELRS